MRLLIVLISGIPDSEIKKMSITDFNHCKDYLMSFGSRSFREWRQLAVDVTYFYQWGPHEAWSLSKSRLLWWVKQTNKILDRG